MEKWRHWRRRSSQFSKVDILKFWSCCTFLTSHFKNVNKECLKNVKYVFSNTGYHVIILSIWSEISFWSQISFVPVFTRNLRWWYCWAGRLYVPTGCLYKPLLYLAPFGRNLLCKFCLDVVSPQLEGWVVHGRRGWRSVPWVVRWWLPIGSTQ